MLCSVLVWEMRGIVLLYWTRHEKHDVHETMGGHCVLRFDLTLTEKDEMDLCKVDVSLEARCHRKE